MAHPVLSRHRRTLVARRSQAGPGGRRVGRRLGEGVPDNRQVVFDDDGWRLKTDPAEHPDPAQSDSLVELHRWLDARSRSIRLADLLIEVENDLGFSVHFQRPGERVDPGEVCALLAAILAHGCNLGLYTMEKVAPVIAYRRLKDVSDWRLVEENQRAALAGIVHGISRLDAAGHWGDGTTSASDGQRFAMPHKVLQRTYSTRFKTGALQRTLRTTNIIENLNGSVERYTRNVERSHAHRFTSGHSDSPGYRPFTCYSLSGAWNP